MTDEPLLLIRMRSGPLLDEPCGHGRASFINPGVGDSGVGTDKVGVELMQAILCQLLSLGPPCLVTQSRIQARTDQRTGVQYGGGLFGGQR